MTAGLFFTFGLVALLTTVNALRRPVPPGKGFPPLWLPGMLVSELAPWLFLVRILVGAGFLWAGALQSRIGLIGMALLAAAQLGLVPLVARTLQAARQAGVSPLRGNLFRVWDRIPSGVEVLEQIPYATGLTLDIYHRPGRESAPVLVYVHPGSWMRGRPGRQARPLFHQLAAEGWVILDIRYPLSPAATFPDHLVGVKRAIAWARNGGAIYGIDPGRVFISGGSSGAHLAALAGLTWDRKDLQPGFEDEDTSVLGCIPSYGIYDLLVRNPTRYDWPFIAQYVMKADKAESPSLYQLGSPVDQVRADAPPFLVIHGEYDSVVLPEESAHFVAALEEVGAAVDHLEVKGAQHGFDAISSMRTRAVCRLAAEWLRDLANPV